MEEVTALAMACSPRYPSAVRNRALVFVLGTTGLRISEALELRERDYDRQRGVLRVRRGKGGKQRLSPPMSVAAARALDRWLERRRELGIDSSAPIFCTCCAPRGPAERRSKGPGQRLETAYVRALLPRLAKRAGIEKRCHPHGLRHSFAAEMIRRGVRINTLSMALGHSSSGTTARYIDSIEPAYMVDEIRAARGES